jgi:hypothetical protein
MIINTNNTKSEYFGIANSENFVKKIFYRTSLLSATDT